MNILGRLLCYYGYVNASSSGDDFIEPRWSITSIYNPEYQGIVDEQERREKILPGQWLSCRDGTLIIGWNKQEGLYFKQPDSNQHFEEDLASLESDGDGHKTFLTKSEHREIEENAAVSILRDYGSFFSEEVIQRVFPTFKDEVPHQPPFVIFH